MLTISVLGAVELHHGDLAHSVPAGKTSELLVRLALDAGTVVRADRLVDDLWGADALTTRRNTLQSKVAKLRRALGEAALLVSAEGGYRLAIDPASVDALQVPLRLTEIAAIVDDGDDAAAAALCAVTRRLFRGELLAGAGDGEWVQPHRARLEAAHLQLIETECTARLRLGQVADVIGDLESAVSAMPYQEGLWALLITALYRSGRQADAVRAAQRVRAVLADELGLEPGPRIRELEARVLAHDPELDPDSSGGGASIADAPIGNLPTMTTELVGRVAELAAVGDLVSAHPLVELVGPGGIGKTALAIAVARAAAPPGGAWLARLETTTSADQVVDGVIAALGVTGDSGTLFERLKAVDTVLVFDNCEHVLDAAAGLVQRILDVAPRTRILCTSQAPLGVDGSVVVELRPLALADAVDLFTRRAAAQRRNRLPLTAEAEAGVREVCRSLDGLPLAIELAAARTKTLSVAEIGRRLDDRLDLLSDPTSRRPERRRALRATIGWSYELLFPDDQRGLWALATFAGGATLSAMEHVLAALDVPPRTAIDVVGRLAGRSLLIVDDDGGSARTRYRLLDSIRAFALEAMAEAGVTDAALAAHADWFAGLARASTEGTRGADQATHLAVARSERANVDAALDWCIHNDPALAVAIANGFGWAWVVLGDGRGAQRILTALAAAGPSASTRDRATGLLLAGWFQASLGDLDLARSHVTAAAALAESLGDVELQARSAYYLAYVVAHDGEFRAALDLTDRSRALYARLDHPWDVVANALFAARSAISAGDEARAVETVEHAREALATVADPWMLVRFEAVQGELARLQHRFDDAVTHLGRAAATSHRLGFLQTEAYQVASLGRAQCQAGRYDEGAATLRSAIGKAEATGDVRMAALARIHLARVLRALGDGAGARIAVEHAVEWQRSVGGGEQAVLGECLLAALDAGDGVADSAARLELLLERAEAEANAPAAVFALDTLARLAATAGDLERAAQWTASADRRMIDASHFIAEVDRVDRVDAS